MKLVHSHNIIHIVISHWMFIFIIYQNLLQYITVISCLIVYLFNHIIFISINFILFISIPTFSSSFYLKYIYNFPLYQSIILFIYILFFSSSFYLNYIYIYLHLIPISPSFHLSLNHSVFLFSAFSPMARETWVQSQVESYQRLKKLYLMPPLLNTQHYKVRIKGKVEQSREGVAPSLTHWCSSYRKGSLRVTLDYGRQLYLLYI